MISIYTAWKFSLNAYEINKKIKLQGWELYQDSSHFKKNYDGYHGVAFINKASKEVVVSSSGTNTGEHGAEDMVADLVKDYEILKGKLPSTFYDNETFFAKTVIQSLPKYQDYKFYFTGHSYGAVVAEASQFILSKDLKINAKSITFDSPGSAPMISAIDCKVKFPLPGITIFNGKPNLINTCNKQSGQVFLIDNSYGDFELDKNYDFSSVANDVKKFIQLTLTRHSLEKMGQSIDKNTEDFVFSKAVNNWPVLGENLLVEMINLNKHTQKIGYFSSRFGLEAVETYKCLKSKVEGVNCYEPIKKTATSFVEAYHHIKKAIDHADEVVETVQNIIQPLGLCGLANKYLGYDCDQA